MTLTESKYSVELANIVKRFGDIVAVNNVSLKISDGEFFSLLGPSGCGKTTTLRIIGGFETPTEGEVLIKGEPMQMIPPFRRPVNTVFQNYALFPHMNIFQNVAFGLQMKKVPKAEIKKRVEDILDLVQLPGMGKRKPSQLSGGQQQRVALARALINHPSVLLLDEPLGALDLKLRKAMQLELKRIQKQVGITFIYVTHDQEEALTMSDRIAVMNEGNVLQVDIPEEIYEHPANRFVANFIGETNFMHGKVQSVTGDEVEVLIDDQIAIATPKMKEVVTGAEVVLAVRPEKLVISREPTSDARVQGTIKEMIYIGTDLRYEVAISESTTLTVREQNSSGDDATRFQNGEAVSVAWKNDHVTLLVE
jgi:spermidine/putrescine transport system ATP-binding protein